MIYDWLLVSLCGPRIARIQGAYLDKSQGEEGLDHPQITQISQIQKEHICVHR